MEFNFNSYDNSKQSISYCEVNKCNAVIKLRKCLQEIKEILKEICIEECLFDWNKTNKKHCGDCDCRFMQLLEKISECEVE